MKLCESVKKVTIIMVVRETLWFSKRILDALYQHTDPGIFKLIYVTGKSSRRDRIQLEMESVRRGFQLITRPYHLAPNEARNLALPYVDTEYVVLLDNDCLVMEGWLEALLNCAKETGAALVSPVVLFGEPEERMMHFFTGLCHIVEEEGGRTFKEGYPYHLKPLSDLKQPLHRQCTELLEYHCLMIRREFLDQVGPFDEDLKSTRDHLDLSLRAQEMGVACISEPTACVAYLHPPKFLWREKRGFC
ncbi:MAG: glycosyltransferase [Blastochloris sp.]|nr:glycosyltransferase [Blastochloris sp.]